MSFHEGDRVKHVDGWSGEVRMVMPEVPGEEITVRVMRMNSGMEEDVPASELMNMSKPRSESESSNVPLMGGRRRKSHRKARKSHRKARKSHRKTRK